MTSEDPNTIEALLQAAKLEHQTTDDVQPSPPDETDDLLAQLKQNHQNQPQKVPVNSPKRQLNLQAIRLSQQQKKQAITEAKDHAQNATDDLLTHLKTKHQTQESHANEYNLNIKAIRLSEQEKQQQAKRLTQQAKLWLEKLDPYSDEGFWFAQFAESYESRLDAAIDYLAALET
ncbi:MAG: hypothetical protein AB4041_10190 [Microcystaceae cyanobacterium]